MAVAVYAPDLFAGMALDNGTRGGAIRIEGSVVAMQDEAARLETPLSATE